jgi:hypothetical protein
MLVGQGAGDTSDLHMGRREQRRPGPDECTWPSHKLESFSFFFIFVFFSFQVSNPNSNQGSSFKFKINAQSKITS